MARQLSRPKRWADAAGNAVAALEELQEVWFEYQEMYENISGLPAEQTPFGEKVVAVNDLDIESALETAQEAEGMDLPLGFGRD